MIDAMVDERILSYGTAYRAGAKRMTLLRITAPHFCAAIDLDDRVWCAPIIAYMRGWTLKRIQEYCHRKGWQVTVISEKSS